MRKLYVIGNGFDLHHKLNTSYSHYKEFLSNEHPEFIERFDDFLKRYVFVEPEEIMCWSRLESYTSRIYDYDLYEILDEAIASAEPDMDRASYWHDIQYLSDYYSQWINGIRTSFKEWICDINYHSVNKDDQLLLDPSAMYLSFNYTHTLETVYDIAPENILHIHGDIFHEIIFGNDTNPDCLIPQNHLHADYDEDSDWRVSEASEILNSTLEETKLYYKNTEHQIQKHQRFFQDIDQCEQIIFMGFGFGEEDQNYMAEILSYTLSLRHVTLYHYNDSDIFKFNEAFADYLKPHVSIEYISW